MSMRHNAGDMRVLCTQSMPFYSLHQELFTLARPALSHPYFSRLSMHEDVQMMDY